MATVPVPGHPRRVVSALRVLLLTLLVAAAAAGATFANVSLLGNAARSGDPIGRLTPTSYRIAPAKPERHHTRAAAKPPAVAAGRTPHAPTAPVPARRQASSREVQHHDHRAGSRADD